MPPKDSLVLFVDMLGFGDLVEQYPDQLEVLRPIFQPITSIGSAASSTLAATDNPLVSRFTGFHLALEKRIRDSVKGEITAITFSDAAFVQLPTLTKMSVFACRLMRECLAARVPVRMGIGGGSFHALRFMSDNTSTAHVHSTQFLGSAVVRAHKAEQSGITGMRILLHPSIQALVDPKQKGVRVLRLHETKPDAYAELNYLPKDTEGHLIAGNPHQPDFLLKCVGEMKAAAPASKAHYYDNTARALKRMKADLVQ